MTVPAEPLNEANVSHAASLDAVQALVAVNVTADVPLAAGAETLADVDSVRSAVGAVGAIGALLAPLPPQPTAQQTSIPATP